jgi:hypothetical protein
MRRLDAPLLHTPPRSISSAVCDPVPPTIAIIHAAIRARDVLLVDDPLSVSRFLRARSIIPR